MKIGDIVKVKVINKTSKNEFKTQIFRVINKTAVVNCFNAERLDNKFKIKIDKDGFPIYRSIMESDILEYMNQ